MRIRLSSVLDVSAERAWAAVRRPSLLHYVAYPLQTFEPINPPTWPPTWADGRYKARLRMFGVLPIGSQWIVISNLADGPRSYRLRDNGNGSLVRQWDHLITIEPITASRCRYTDEVAVRAGLLTPAVTAFAYLFYLHRQRRWRKLVAFDFAPIGMGAAA